MATHTVGLDFGTSNSSVAVSDGSQVRVLPIDPRALRPELYRSVMFFSDEAELFTGGQAIVEYLEQGQGRLVQSIKSFLPSTSFSGTQIRGKIYRLEELVAILLRRIRLAAEEALGGEVTHVLMGRPARFSTDPVADALAEKRLRAAARLAGFTHVDTEIEPIAAALAYEANLATDQLVLVGDFGAGTSDFTVMRLGPGRRNEARTARRESDARARQKDILGTSGVALGGDKIDSTIMEHKLLAHFGAGSTYQLLQNRLPMPPSILAKLLSWHEMSFIKERKVQELLLRIQDCSDRPKAIAALRDLVDSNLGFALYQHIEGAKVRLSSELTAAIVMHEGDVDLDEALDRRDFDAWTQPLRDRLDECVTQLLGTVGVIAAEIDLVVLTGGSSQVPGIRQIFVDRFGQEKLRAEEAFISVAAGLGLAAAALPS